MEVRDVVEDLEEATIRLLGPLRDGRTFDQQAFESVYTAAHRCGMSWVGDLSMPKRGAAALLALQTQILLCCEHLPEAQEERAMQAYFALDELVRACMSESATIPNLKHATLQLPLQF